MLTSLNILCRYIKVLKLTVRNSVRLFTTVMQFLQFQPPMTNRHNQRKVDPRISSQHRKTNNEVLDDSGVEQHRRRAQVSVFLSWPTVNNCDLFVSGREQMSAGMGNVQRLRTRGEKMHTISWWQRGRQFSVSFPAVS